MNHREIQQTRQLEKLRSYRTVNLHYESVKMQHSHQERMRFHVNAVELSYVSLNTALKDISDSLHKLVTKPLWRFWK